MTALAERYHALIVWIVDRTQLPDNILHLHAGMAVLLLARVLTRRGLGTFVPLSFVIAAEFANELMDRIGNGSWRWPETGRDLFNTLLWPTVLCLAIRLRPLVAARRRG